MRGWRGQLTRSQPTTLYRISKRWHSKIRLYLKDPMEQKHARNFAKLQLSLKTTLRTKPSAQQIFFLMCLAFYLIN